MNVPEFIRRKREGEALTPDEIKEFIDGYVAGNVPEYQVSAFLMAVFFKGMTPEEAAAFTRSMLESGDRFDLSDIEGPKVDKHSTGGVGDKVSMILAPLMAAADCIVPMVSGRGLGHTGGTLDKLDSIPGYKWNLNEKDFKKVLGKVGCAIIGQTDNFVPADKQLYSLRDVTATVESVPLICGSILSKKVASGVEALVMDVKCGSGAFMENEERANELARNLVEIGTALGKPVSAIITQMNQPLGIAVGNALEMRETIDILKGHGPSDAREITLVLCAEMLCLAKKAANPVEAHAKLSHLLDSGAALDKFKHWMEAQGGDPDIIDKPSLLEVSDETDVVEASRAGYVQSVMTRDIGVACNTLGGGRMKKTDEVDLTVGLLIHKKPGDKVEKGEPLATLHHRGGKGLEDAKKLTANAYRLGEAAPAEELKSVIGEMRAR